MRWCTRSATSLPAAHAAFIEPLSCALHAVERASIALRGRRGGRRLRSDRAGHGRRRGRQVAGPGHRPRSAPTTSSTLAREVRRHRDPQHRDATTSAAAVQDLTDGYGADVYLEGSGHPSAVGQGLQLLRKLGTFVEYSVFGSEVTVDWIDHQRRQGAGRARRPPRPALLAGGGRMLESGRLPLDRDRHPPAAAEPSSSEGLDLVGDGHGVDQGRHCCPVREGLPPIQHNGRHGQGSDRVRASFVAVFAVAQVLSAPVTSLTWARRRTRGRSPTPT